MLGNGHGDGECNPAHRGAGKCVYRATVLIRSDRDQRGQRCRKSGQRHGELHSGRELGAVLSDAEAGGRIAGSVMSVGSTVYRVHMHVAGAAPENDGDWKSARRETDADRPISLDEGGLGAFACVTEA